MRIGHRAKCLSHHSSLDRVDIARIFDSDHIAHAQADHHVPYDAPALLYRDPFYGARRMTSLIRGLFAYLAFA